MTETKQTTIEDRKCNLSDEHRSQIFFNGLYKADPEDFRSFWQSDAKYWATSGKYHCKNWCFEPRLWIDGRVFMTDNYWSGSSHDNSYEITDDNFDEMMPKFELVMEDREDWKKIDPSLAPKYAPEDVIYKVASGSGGYTCGSTTWVRKDAKPATDRLLASNRADLSSAIRRALGSVYDIKRALEKVEGILDEGNGEDLFDSAAIAEENALLEKCAQEPVMFGDVFDATDYLADRCYCPGEIYDTGGFFYNLYSPDDEISKIGGDITTDGGNTVCSYVCRDKGEILQILVKGDGHIEDVVRFDATANNIRECLSSKPPREYSLDEFSPARGNRNILSEVEKAKRVIDAIEVLKKELDGE